ncbi:hypothetical protein [Hyalangium minutum]|uniref:Phosphate-selective porin O and P n=1 Tax=Hyalangium minutum TaxID=394096 RepID=A0A085WAA6_9BACT|nr:hypothetical protein [Hyalangium minutum]KFE64619.1 hypothetical protein DB31_1637 [Hyalangium minutum]
MRPSILFSALLCAVTLFSPFVSRAEEREEEEKEAQERREAQEYRQAKVHKDEDRDEDEEDEHKKKRPKLKVAVGGYADLQFAYYNHGLNQNREGGAQKDSRLTFDTTRVVLEVEGGLPEYGIEAEVEVEFEHGGTGSAMELEYEEFGEFEQEVDKGGEVLIEELYLKKEFGEHFAVSLGRFYVAVGTLSAFYRPTQYLGTIRSEAETLIIPNTWDEMGLQAVAKVGGMQLTAQVVNGLDSTAFSSQRWVAEGHQRRFEMVRATDLAAVLRADVTRFDGLVFGASGYYGDSTRNRPKPDLLKLCEDGNPRDVAPCGYVSAPLLLLDAHLSLEQGPWRAKALAMWGYLQNAGAISARNARLSNFLNVPRTPVADHALAVWAELGFDIAPRLGLSEAHRLEPYVRFDYADSIVKPRTELFDNARFERSIYTVGAAYTLAGMGFGKLDFSHRRLGDSSRFRPENTVRVSTGFSY